MKILPHYYSVTLPVIIDGPGKYRTRCGETVVITHIQQGGGCDRCGFYDTGEETPIRDRWHKSGRVYPSTDSNNDILEKLK